MDDVISRKAAIDALNDEFTIIGKANAIVVQDYIRRVNNRLHDLPSAQPEPYEELEPCDLCSNLGKGDTLYQSSDWDGGIGFDYIWDIQYCPKCGRRLEE